jgi:hypothetical protein
MNSDHIYLNLDVVNDGTTEQQPLVFSETRTIPFLEAATDYYCSVIRFCLQTSNSLPVFIPDIQVGQTNANLTVYSVKLKLMLAITNPGYPGYPSGRVYFENETFIIYAPSDLTQPTPPAPSSRLVNSLPYYWVQNITEWVVMVNTTLQTATNDLFSLYAESPALSPEGKGFRFQPPFISYDISTGLFTLHKDVDVDARFTNGFINLDIIFNTRLYNILPFPAFRQTDGYKINIPGNAEVNQLLTLSQNQYITVSTEFSPLSLMCPIKSISFTTNTLPIQATLTQPPKIYNSGSISSNSGLPDISNIIADYQIPISAENTYNGEIIYQPSAELRLMSMNNSFNLNKIDLNCFWIDKYGREHQVYLQPGCSASLKLLFRHKRFNYGSNAYF